MDLPKNFDSRHWWILVGVAGALIATSSGPVKFVPGFLVGLALLMFGVGQWIDHPLREQVGPGFTITGYPWRPSLFGMLLTLGGIAIFGLGVYRLAFT